MAHLNLEINTFVVIIQLLLFFINLWVVYFLYLKPYLLLKAKKENLTDGVMSLVFNSRDEINQKKLLYEEKMASAYKKMEFSQKEAVAMVQSKISTELKDALELLTVTKNKFLKEVQNIKDMESLKLSAFAKSYSDQVAHKHFHVN